MTIESYDPVTAGQNRAINTCLADAHRSEHKRVRAVFVGKPEPQPFAGCRHTHKLANCNVAKIDRRRKGDRQISGIVDNGIDLNRRWRRDGLLYRHTTIQRCTCRWILRDGDGRRQTRWLWRGRIAPRSNPALSRHGSVKTRSDKDCRNHQPHNHHDNTLQIAITAPSNLINSILDDNVGGFA